VGEQRRRVWGLAADLATKAGFQVVPSPWAMETPIATKLRRDALPRSALLHDQVGQLVAAQEVRQRERRLTAGRFDRRAVARAAMGALDVCAHRHVTPGCNTAVCLLLDLSGSMVGLKLATAQTMAIHLSEAVDMAGGHCAVLGFADPTRNRADREGCSLVLFKDWTETPALGARRIAAAGAPFGTPLSPGIMSAARWMLNTVEADRHVLGVLTDGDCEFGPVCVQSACRYATKLGVDLFALGCLHDTSESFDGFPRADVQRLADLPRVAMRTLLAELAR
jgi:Mg-chelatase subunit ChlD